MSRLLSGLNLVHFFRMTDDTGIFQHAKYGVPDRFYGYTTDDNARALIAAVKLYAMSGEKEYLELVFRYLPFLYYARDGRGRFRNFMNYERQFLEKTGSEDCYGRCVWALGTVWSYKDILPSSLTFLAREMLEEAVPQTDTLVFPRAMAYAVIGMKISGLPEFKERIIRSADRLVECFQHCASEDWLWFEESITYGNAVLPWALFAAWNMVGDRKYLNVAENSFNFLMKISLKDDVFSPVGCRGWYSKGGVPATYDQQPLEACETIFACREAFAATREEKYKIWAGVCLDWYYGKNIAGQSMIDPQTGGCFDGVKQQGLNQNQGAESLISYILAELCMREWQEGK